MAVPTIPPGSTFFDMVKKSFTDVPIDKEHGNAVSTSEFLEASESLTALFGTLVSLDWDFPSGRKIHGNGREEQRLITYCIDVLGSVAFKPVKNDIIGNVKVSHHEGHEHEKIKKAELEAWRQLEKKFKRKHTKCIRVQLVFSTWAFFHTPPS